MTKGLVTIFGGSGFIGRYAARELIRAGWQVRIACRRPGLAGDVRLAGAPGWVDLVQANVRNRDSIARALDGADAVVNLVGILNEGGRQSFDATQLEGAKNIAELAKEAGITRFVQVSAIGADTASNSKYARTKAQAEEAVREAIPDAVILRPSIVFGPEDDFFNRFAGLTKVSPFLFAIGGGKTKLQPVYAGDVADAITAAVMREDVQGKTFELGGPGTYSFNEIYDFVCETVCRKRLKLPVPFFFAKPTGLIFGAIFRYIPPIRWIFGGPPITGGQVELLKTDNVVSEGALGLADLGVTQLESIEAIAPAYLWRHRPYGEYTETGKA